MRKGYTLFEFVIVLAIIAIICVISISSLGSFREGAALDSANQDIFTALHEARELTLSSKDAQVYGVHFQTDMAVRFMGASYATGSASNVEYKFDPRARVVNITLSGGGSNIVFKRLTGEADKSGTIVVAVYDDDKMRATTTISLSGIIE